MDINRLSSTEMLADYRAYNVRLVRSMDRLSTGELASQAKDDPILWAEVEELKQFATILTGFSDNLNRASASVRIALDSMDLSKAHVAEAKQKLNEAFVAKPGSDERRNALASYNELLDLVDDAAQAPDAGARRLLDSPDNFPDAGNIKVSAGEAGYSITLNAQEIHTGANGLDLARAGEARPSDLIALPSSPPIIADIADATNEEIKAMIDLLDQSEAKLLDKAKALTVDVAGVEDSQSFNDVFIQRNKILSERINVPNLKAEAVIAQSLQVKSSLAISGLGSSNSSYKLALQLIR